MVRTRENRPGRERPTGAELESALARLDVGEAARIRARIQVAPERPRPEPSGPLPPPVYASWEDYRARTSEAERRRRCAVTAKRANRPRLMSGRPQTRITADDVQAVLEAARGRCAHCGSLAVESRPSRPDGAPVPWERIGRRIGSLGHLVSRFAGGANAPGNLVWSCLWCNTWPGERRMGASDHGGYHPTWMLPVTRDTCTVRYMTPEEAEQLLSEWAIVTRDRDNRVRAAVVAGVSKHRIHQLTGIGRSTIDRILAADMPSRPINGPSKGGNDG